MCKSKIHPCKKRISEKHRPDTEEITSCCCSESASVLTVWKKSSMGFEGTDGFSVFDDCGKLCFRVENYTRNKQRSFGINGGCGVLVLMDGAGIPLLTLKPQRFSLQHRWNAYKGTEECDNGDGSQVMKPLVFSMRKESMLGNVKYENEAEIFMGRGELPDFKIEGCYRRRMCRIRRYENGEVIARISRKKVMMSNMTLSDEVFSLVVVPGFSRQLVMAFVVILDRICGKKYMPSLCCVT